MLGRTVRNPVVKKVERVLRKYTDDNGFVALHHLNCINNQQIVRGTLRRSRYYREYGSKNKLKGYRQMPEHVK